MIRAYVSIHSELPSLDDVILMLPLILRPTFRQRVNSNRGDDLTA